MVELDNFGRESRNISRTLRLFVIDHAISKLEKASPNYHQAKIQFKNLALKFNAFSFIVDAGIDEANKLNGDTRLIETATETVQLFQTIGLLK